VVVTYKIPNSEEIRNRIERIGDETFRNAFMYQYLMACEPSEVYGKYSPMGKDVLKIDFKIYGGSYPAVIFRVKRCRGKNPSVCVLPLDPKLEPWTVKLLEWFTKYESDETAFNFGKNKQLIRRDNQTVGMTEARKIFKGYSWLKSPYKLPKKGKNAERRYVKYTSSMLRASRKKNLIEDYYFDDLDLAKFGGWNEPIDYINKEKIKEILNMKHDKINEKKCKEQSISYFKKFLKPYSELGNEITDFYVKVNDHKDLRKRIEKTQTIIELLNNTNILFEGKIDYKFSIDDTSELLFNLLSICADKVDFRNKIVRMASIFEVKYDEKGNIVETWKSGKTSTQIIEDWLNDKKINYDENMILTWNSIKKLRNNESHSEINSKEYLDLLSFFGLPRKIPPDYGLLWDNIVNKLISSLKEWNKILNEIP